MTKWPLLGYLIKFVIKFRMQVLGNDSMDLFTQYHVCCDTGDWNTFSLFNLNAAWPKWNELTKWPFLGHLSKLVIKFRMQVVRQWFDGFVYTKTHVLWHSKYLHFFPFSFECFLVQMKWVDQMTFPWSFE